MWQPKCKNNDFYIGRTARIYYKKDKEYFEGKLLYIKESPSRKNVYSVQILDKNNYTRNTTVSELIEKIDVEIFEIGEEVEELCKNLLVADLGNIVNEYTNRFITI
jgi:hypothetical protein